jgi:predicted DNA-binding transcriptional regulator AlpA
MFSQENAILGIPLIYWSVAPKTIWRKVNDRAFPAGTQYKNNVETK